MSRKKINSKEIEKKILEIVDNSIFSITIREVTMRLREDYDIKLSPQIVKRYLFKLKKEDKIE